MVSAGCLSALSTLLTLPYNGSLQRDRFTRVAVIGLPLHQSGRPGTPKAARPPRGRLHYVALLMRVRVYVRYIGFDSRRSPAIRLPVISGDNPKRRFRQ